MSALGSVIGQSNVNDLGRLGMGAVKLLSGSLGMLDHMTFGGSSPEVSTSQFVSGAKDLVTAGIGFSARMLSAVGGGVTTLADGMSWVLDNVSSTATEHGGSMRDNAAGMLAGAAKTVLGASVMTGSAMALDSQSFGEAGSLGGEGLADMAASGGRTAMSLVGTATGMASTALKFTTGVVDTVTGHPVKAYDLMVGNATPGVTAEKRTQADDALRAVQTHPRATEGMKALMTELGSLGVGIGNPDFVADMLSGAHVVVEDGGARYTRWNSTADLGAHHRDSSHYSDGKGIMAKLNGAVRDPLHSGDEQRGFDVPGLGHVLFGTCLTAPGAETRNTWFQFEGHGTSARETVPHGADWVLHKASGNAQVGPLGYAARTEKPDSTGRTSHIVVPDPDAH